MKIRDLLSMEFKKAMDILSSEKELSFKTKRKLIKLMKYLQGEIDTAFKIYQDGLKDVVEMHEGKPIVKENAHVILEGKELDYAMKNEEYLNQDVEIDTSLCIVDDEIDKAALSIKDLMAIEKILL